jgi:hypothetical protein
MQRCRSSQLKRYDAGEPVYLHVECVNLEERPRVVRFRLIARTSRASSETTFDAVSRGKRCARCHLMHALHCRECRDTFPCFGNQGIDRRRSVLFFPCRALLLKIQRTFRGLPNRRDAQDE